MVLKPNTKFQRNPSGRFRDIKKGCARVSPPRKIQVVNVSLPVAAPVTYPKVIPTAKKMELLEHLKVAQESTSCLYFTLAYMTNSAQWPVVIGFVGVGLHSRTGSSTNDRRFSQERGSHRLTVPPLNSRL